MRLRHGRPRMELPVGGINMAKTSSSPTILDREIVAGDLNLLDEGRTREQLREEGRQRRALARAHARTGEPALIAGYCGGSGVLGEVLADWAEAYGDQNASDHAALVEAIKTGRVKAVTG